MKKENLIIALAEFFGKLNGATLMENTEDKTVYWGGVYSVILNFNKDSESVDVQYLPEFNEIYHYTYCYNDSKFMDKVKKDYAIFAQDLLDFYSCGTK